MNEKKLNDFINYFFEIHILFKVKLRDKVLYWRLYVSKIKRLLEKLNHIRILTFLI